MMRKRVYVVYKIEKVIDNQCMSVKTIPTISKYFHKLNYVSQRYRERLHTAYDLYRQ